jgi:hypothetical protein
MQGDEEAGGAEDDEKSEFHCGDSTLNYCQGATNLTISSPDTP